MLDSHGCWSILQPISVPGVTGKVGWKGCLEEWDALDAAPDTMFLMLTFV